MPNDISFNGYSIVACGTLRRELNQLQNSGFLDADKVLYTTPGLHEHLDELERQLKKQLETAKKCFLDVLKLTPDLHEAKSLLAEVYELTQDYNNALITYQEAIKSQINDDPDWKTRLLCGIGRTSIKLNQPEIAIETLKKALIAKGYTNVLSVINAPIDELKFLLSLDDDAVNQLLETLKPKELEDAIQEGA